MDQDSAFVGFAAWHILKSQYLENEMPQTESLREIVEQLANIDPALSPVAKGNLREDLLVKGLHALAAEYGKEIEFTRIEGNGDMRFNIKGERQYDKVEYGEELAAVLSRVPHRTGVQPTDAALLPENNWCWLNHFAVERLLVEAVDLVPSAIASSASQVPGM